MPEKLDFITPTVLKILYIFHNDPIRERHEREVIRDAQISKGSANSILRRLSEAGILERRKAGRMVFYRFNSRNATARQLKILFNVHSLQNLVDQLKLHCRRITLFGSCAEGLDTSESDVDLFILTQNKERVMEEVSDYQRNLERNLSPIVLNANELVKLKSEDEPLYERIEKGIILWESG